jgi:hypothetical protein
MRSAPLVALVLAVVPPLAAQRAPTGRIEGVVWDSTHALPLAGATVSATLAGPLRDTTFTARADAEGRFRFDSLRAGRYAMSFASALLDSLQYGGPAPQVVVSPPATATVRLAIPSGATLRATACPGVTFPEGSGVLLGLVLDAATERPLAGAQVAVAWSALKVDTTTRTVFSDERAARVTVDASGQYRLCGLPTDDQLFVQVQHDGRAGAVLPMRIAEAVGVLVRDVSFSAAGALALEADSAAANGRARLAGTVRDARGRPVAGAQVRVIGTEASVRTDERGAYALGGLPAGSQQIEVRQLGYGIARGSVELRDDRRTRLDVELEGVTLLEGLNVVAEKPKYPEFEERRKTGVFGSRFLDEEQIRKLNLHTSWEIVNAVPGFRAVQQHWGDVRIFSIRDPGCQPVVLVDDLPVERMEDIPLPGMVGAIEVYQGTAGAPPTHRSPCGTIVFWTKH